MLISCETGDSQWSTFLVEVMGFRHCRYHPTSWYWILLLFSLELAGEGEQGIFSTSI